MDIDGIAFALFLAAHLFAVVALSGQRYEAGRGGGSRRTVLRGTARTGSMRVIVVASSPQECGMWVRSTRDAEMAVAAWALTANAP